MMQITSSAQATINKINILKQYLRIKVDEEDWHGVADAAMDLRELQAQLVIYVNQETMQKNAQDAISGLGLTPTQEKEYNQSRQVRRE